MQSFLLEIETGELSGLVQHPLLFLATISVTSVFGICSWWVQSIPECSSRKPIALSKNKITWQWCLRYLLNQTQTAGFYDIVKYYELKRCKLVFKSTKLNSHGLCKKYLSRQQQQDLVESTWDVASEDMSLSSILWITRLLLLNHVTSLSLFLICLSQ